MSITQYYHYGHVSSNFAPEGKFDDQSRNHVMHISQILHGDFQIPQKCHAVSFAIYDEDDEPFQTQIKSALFVKRENIRSLEKIRQEYDDNSEICDKISELGGDFAIDYGDGKYSLPLEQQGIFIVEGEDYNYKIAEFKSNPAFGAAEDPLWQEFLLRCFKKKYFSNFFSSN